MRLAVLASHEGTTLQAVIDHCQAGTLAAEVSLVVSNNSSSGAMRRAAQAGIRTLHISGKTHESDAAADTALLEALQSANTDYVLLLGYMKKLGPETLGRFSGKIINIHPSLLPKYGGQGMYGMRVHEAVIANGDSESGLTVHFVDGDYDTGPILQQRTVSVFPSDTPASLAERIIAEEHRLLVKTLIELVGP